MVKWWNFPRLHTLGGQTFPLGCLGAFIRQRCLGMDFQMTSFFTDFDSTNWWPFIGTAKTVGAVSANNPG